MMLRRYRQRNPGQPLWKLLWWDAVCKPLSWLVVRLLYGHRWWGAHNVPERGPVLLVCNHQSYLDLIVLGVGLHRHFHSMARASLFHNPVFGWLIRSLNAFPVDQDRSDIRSVRTAIDLLKRGHLVLVFPEGSRTRTGKLELFAPGLMLLVRRAKPTVVPMAVDGVYDAWSIHRKWPRLRARTGAMYGRPIPAEQLLAMDSQDAVRLLRDRIEDLRLDVRARLRLASRGRWPSLGPGDVRSL